MFIIVKEIGEYSSFDYEVIGYYHEKKKAEYAVGLLKYEKSLKDELNHLLTGGYAIECEYVIKEIPDGCHNINILDETHFLSEKNKILQKYESEIREAKINRVIMEEEKARVLEEKQNQEKEKRKKEVLEFWDWWTNGELSDSYFHDKKSAKVRDILPTMQKFLLDEPTNRDMYDFFIQNKSFLYNHDKCPFP